MICAYVVLFLEIRLVSCIYIYQTVRYIMLKFANWKYMNTL